MSRTGRTALYSPDLLALAVGLADYPLDQRHACSASERSRTCGSRIDVSLDLNEDGAIGAIGLQVSACAVGQAAAAILARDALGKTCADIERAADEIGQWLSGEGGKPHWRGIDALEPALPHKGRHEAILLPWKTARAALCNPETPR